ncbi:MAG: hypothetical protein ABW321_06525, partial [Polyangiales bacterium]
MYVTVLGLHSWLRWIVLAAGIGVLITAIGALSANARSQTRTELWHAAFIGLLDLQFLLGLSLYLWLSPIAAAARAAIGPAMKNPTLRFFGVEHVVTMLLAIVVAHVGRARARRKEGRPRARTVVIAQALWLLLTLAAIPWPGLDVARPL